MLLPVLARSPFPSKTFFFKYINTCGLVQGSLIRQGEQAIGGVLEGLLHTHWAGRMPLIQLAAGHARSTFRHVGADVHLQGVEGEGLNLC